ncbi:LamG-like jellyroll fold domain-containing protein [Kitasatospora griseola]|uniref:LamG-like jellyroll fold domain-containing protein n=1 Tax=Kitasatospora griseola TaxID=2064 RepID=UPI0038557E19
MVQTAIAEPATAFTTQQSAKAATARAAADTPHQLEGSADGRSGSVPASATSRSGAGAGKHSPAPGELPADTVTDGAGPQPSEGGRGAIAAQPVAPPDSPRSTGTPVSQAEKDGNPAYRGQSAADTTALPGPASDGAEVVGARNRDSATFTNPDGTKTTRVYSRPVHYRKPDGTWANIDTNFTTAAGRWTETANSQDISFAARADDRTLVTLAVDADHKVSYGLQGAAPVKATANGDTLTYPRAARSTDVVYNGLANGIKETLVLNDADAPTSWTFPLDLTGLTPVVGSLGDLEFRDASGAVRLTMPRGSMEDANVDVHSGQGAISTGVNYTLITVDGKPAMRMDLDAAWLHDKARAYPVRVDPTSAGNVNAGRTTFVESGAGGYNGNNSGAAELRVGTYDNGGHVDNSYLYFPGVGSALHNQFVVGAKLHAVNTHSWNCDGAPVYINKIDSGWDPSTIHDFPGLTIGQQLAVNTASAGDKCSVGIRDEIFQLGKNQLDPGTALVNSWANDGANYGLAMTASSTDVNGWKKYDSVNTSYPPYLEITYADWAAVYGNPTSYTPPTATQPGSMPLTMTNRSVNWWNSSSMQVKPRFYNSNNIEVFPAANVPLTGVPGLVKTGETVTFNATIPPLPAGQNYQMCWDGQVNGNTSLADSYNVMMGACVWIQSQNANPQIDTVLPLGNTQVGTITPELYASGHDPDNYPGNGLDYDFQVYSTPVSGSPQKLADSGWQPSNSWRVPAGILAWNSTYTWTVKVGDHIGESLPTTPIPFSTTVQQPLITSRLGGAVGNGTTRSFDPQAGNYTTGTTDASVVAVGPALAVNRTYNSLDPRTASLFGGGWSSLYDMSVVPDADGSGGVVLTTASGRAERFGRNDFQLTKLAGAGDQTGDGIDDAVAVDSSTGKLWLYPGPDFSQAKRRLLGDGWSGMSRIAGGDVTGDGVGEVLAVDGSGALKLYPGRAGTSLGTPVTLAADGWNGMTGLAVTPPLAADGKKDLVAVDPATGTLYAYPIAADGSSIGARTALGGSWNGLRELTGGDFNHDGRGDLVAIDGSGNLLLYPGIGNATLGSSTLGSPVQLGTGWDGMRDLTPVNGIAGDPGTDILAVDKATGVQYLYHSGSTPQWSAAARTTTGMAVYTSPAGEFETLAARAGGGFTLADKTGTVYTFAQPAGAGFLLTQITDRQQHTQALRYTGGKLDTVTDQASGRALHFTWTADGRHVAQVATDPAIAGDASTALAWTYSYDTADPDRLAQVCTPPAGTNTARPCTAYTYTTGSHLSSAVLDAGPVSYWRLGEASGTTAKSEAIANQGTDTAAYSAQGVALGTAGPGNGSAATAATFNGTSGVVTLPRNLLDASAYATIGLWFKTTGQGVLFGYQTDAFPAATTTGNYTPALYVGTSGKLYGELWNNWVNPIASANPVNDGKWHYALLTGAGDTQTLYLDGTAQGSRTGQIVAPGQRVATVGAGFTGGIWPDEPLYNGSDNTGRPSYFNGSISDVAFYNRTIGAPAVTTQWTAAQKPSAELTNIALPSGKTKLAVTYDTVNDRATQYTDPNGGVWKLNQPAVAGSEQEYRSAVLGSRPAGYWRLAEGKAGQATNAVYSPRPTPNNGTYSNVALGAAGPTTGSTAATFDGTTSWAEIPAAYAPTTGTGAFALWFKTTGPGVLIGYQSFPIGGAHTGGVDKWNPALYVGTDGKLHGQFWTGDPSKTLVTTATVTDGKWHQAVLSADNPTSQTLYLDGQAAGTLTGDIKPNGQTHVYLGAGTFDGGWPGKSTDPSGHFNGQIADVAAFDHGINAAALYAQAANGTAAYDGAVVDAHPSGYWRLNDTAGNQAADLLTSQALAQNQGTYSNTTQAAGGPYSTGSTTTATFNGTTSYVQLPPNAAPHIGNTATVEVWFKTAKAGVIYSYQSDPIGGATPATYTPVLYVGADGKLRGQVWNGDNTNTAVSATAVNDNAWHMADLVVGFANGSFSQQLFLDGAATGSTITGPTKYTSPQYSYLGAGTVTGWPSQPTDANGHFTGQIADFSYYGYALETNTIGRHYSYATAPAGEAGSQSANYRTGVIDSTPEAYWRLNEPAGAKIVQDTLGTALPEQGHGTYTSTNLGVTGPSGSSDGTAASFNGTTSSLQLPASAIPVRGPNSIELWFKTSNAGVLYGYQSFPLGAAHTGGVDQWNPALYVGTDGKLYGDLWTGDAANTLTSTQNVNDNTWHHAVLAGDDNGQTLYLDGAKEAGSTTKRTVFANGTAYAYVGAGTADGTWPNHPTSPDGRFTGTIAEVAYYPSVLNADAVTAHYKAMGSAAAQTKITTATASDPLSHTLTWRWDARTGQLTATTDANAATTRYSYDTHGFLFSVTDPDGHTTTTGHDERGNTVSTTTCTDAAHCHTAYATYSLDQANPFNPASDRLLTSSDARAKNVNDTTYATSYAYNALGDPTSTTTPATSDFPSGRTATVTYTTGTEAAVGSTGTQPAALVATSTDTAGATTAYAYDKAGNLNRTIAPTGLVTTYTYDNLGRRTTATTTCTDCGPAAASTTTTSTWDGLGNLLTRTDPATTDAITGTVHTRKTTTGYDTDGNPTTQTVSDTTGGDSPRTTTWAYNTHNQLFKTTDPAGRATSYLYDAEAHPINRTDPAGTSWSYTYDGNGRLLRTGINNYTGSPLDPVPSRFQILEARAYDPAGRLATVTDAMGRTTHTYYNDDNSVAETDLDAYRNPDGTQRAIVLQQNTYDAAGHLTQQTSGGGKTTVVTAYDAAGRTTATTLDPGGLNRTTAYTYDAGNNILTSVLAGGGESRETDATYNKVGQVLTQTVKNTPADSVVKNTYDQRGLPLTTTSPLGNVTGADPTAYTTTYSHDALGRLTLTTAPPADTTTVDPATGTATVLHGTRAISRVGYGIDDQPTSTQDPTGNVTTLTHTWDQTTGHHESAARTAYTAPRQNTAVTAVTQVDYDALDRPKTLHDAKNKLTTQTYDQLGNLVETDFPQVDGITPKSLTTFDLAGETLSATGPTGARVEATYDDLGRQITATELVRRTTTTDAYTSTVTYDDAGNATSVTTPAGLRSTAAFNAAGESTSATDSLSNTTTSTYNLAGQPTRITQPGDQPGTAGPAAVTTYDRAGQARTTSRLSTTGTVLATTSTGYDVAGNAVTATDADGNTTTAAFDAVGHVVRHVEPVSATASITTAFGYDAAGHRTAYTDGNGNTTYYTFNTLGLPESTIEPATSAYPNVADRTYTTAYDINSAPATRIEPGGVTLTNTYDALGNVTGQSGTGGEATTSPARTFGYDLAGRLTSLSTPGGTQTFAYDDRGLLATANGPASQASYTYDADGNLTTRTNESGSATYSYDGAGRLKTFAEPLTGTALTYGYTARGQTSTVQYGTGDKRTYTYDDLGNVTGDSLATATGTAVSSLTYTYFPSSRLKTKTTVGLAGATTNTYSYDQAGRLSTWNNGATPTTFGYDANGNLTANGANTATYNQRNQLISNSLGASYTYTARGTRSTSTTGGTTTTATYDAYDKLTAQQGQTYSYDALGRLAQSGTHAFTYDGDTGTLTSDGAEHYSRTPGGTLTAIGATGAAALAYTDRHGDLIGTFTPTATAPAGSTSYDPWGKPTAQTGTTANLGYQGGWTDTATGQVSTSSRWYDPATSGFTSRDTVLLDPMSSARANRYQFGDADPVQNADPDGHSAGCAGARHTVIASGAAAVAAVAGAAVAMENYELGPAPKNPSKYRWFSSGPQYTFNYNAFYASANLQALGYLSSGGGSSLYVSMSQANKHDVLQGLGMGLSAVAAGMYIGSKMTPLGMATSGYSSCDVAAPVVKIDRTKIAPGKAIGGAEGTYTAGATYGVAAAATATATVTATANPTAGAAAFTADAAQEAAGLISTTFPAIAGAGAWGTVSPNLGAVTGTLLDNPIDVAAGAPKLLDNPVNAAAALGTVLVSPAVARAGDVLTRENIYYHDIQQGWGTRGPRGDLGLPGAIVMQTEGMGWEEMLQAATALATGMLTDAAVHLNSSDRLLAKRAGATYVGAVNMETRQIAATCSGNGSCGEINIMESTGWGLAGLIFGRAFEAIPDSVGGYSIEQRDVCVQCQRRIPGWAFGPDVFFDPGYEGGILPANPLKWMRQ